MSAPVAALGLDHIVINIAATERSLALRRPTRARARAGLREAPPRGVVPSVRVDDSTIMDLLPVGRIGENVDHFCLTVPPTDFGITGLCRGSARRQ
jgi:hypothetical protein